MVEWLNSNTGFAMALLTAAYVFCTTILCFLSWHSNKISQRLYREDTRPYLIPAFTLRKQMAFFILTNGGRRAATNVKLTFDVKIPAGGSGRTLDEDPFILAIKTVVPGFPLETLLCLEQQLQENLPDKPVTVSLQYTDQDGHPYHDDFVIDLHGLLKRGYLFVDSVADHLQSIERTLDRLTGGIT